MTRATPQPSSNRYQLVFDQVTKRYDDVSVVEDLSFTVEPGRVTGFLGPNGSGKSTTMKVLLDLAAADHGSAGIGGRRYRDLPDPPATVGVVLEPNAFHPGRSGRNHLLILAQAIGRSADRVDETLAEVGLSPEAARRRVGTYSLGMKQRLSLAGALLASGHLHVTVLDPGVEFELRLGEPVVRTLRTVDPETEFVVCQSPEGATCLLVVRGSVEWEGYGDPFTETQGTFAKPGLAPLSPNCPPVEAYVEWIQRFTTGKDNETLPEFVGRHENSICQGSDSSPAPPTTQPEDTTTTEPEGDGVAAEEPSLPSGEGMTHVVSEQPEIGTDDFDRNPDRYRQRERLNRSFDFFIDTEATTNFDFRAWLSEEARDDSAKWTALAPDSWLRRPPGNQAPTQASFLREEADLPVAGIRWQAAADFCRFHGKRLPTEIEWELAAVNGSLTDVEQSHQDWVDEPRDYQPSTPADLRVLRGTTASESPDLYYRLIVDDTPEGNVARAGAGVRCAADEVQPDTEGDTAGGTPVVDDNFENSESGWPTLPGGVSIEDEFIKIGYHPPSVYHVEPHAEHAQVVVLRRSSDDLSSGLSVTTNAFVESTEEMGAGPDAYRFGLVVGDESGRLMALTVKPNTAVGRYDWCLGPTSDELETAVRETFAAGVEYASAVPGNEAVRHRGESCRNGIARGQLEPADDFSVLKSIGIKLSIGGGVVTVYLDDEEVGQVDDDLDPTTYGFFVEAFHMAKAHIHYEDIAATTP